jgi:hypothetical protein
MSDRSNLFAALPAGTAGGDQRRQEALVRRALTCWVLGLVVTAVPVRAAGLPVTAAADGGVLEADGSETGTRALTSTAVPQAAPHKKCASGRAARGVYRSMLDSQQPDSKGRRGLQGGASER